MREIIHLRISPHDHKDVYLCNWACGMTDGKWAWDKEKVTCKNCLRALAKHITYRQVRKTKYIDEPGEKNV